jgi:hypothetical protein
VISTSTLGPAALAVVSVATRRPSTDPYAIHVLLRKPRHVARRTAGGRRVGSGPHASTRTPEEPVHEDPEAAA